MKKTKEIYLKILIDKELKKKFQRVILEEDETMCNVVRLFVEDYVSKNKSKIKVG